MASETLVAFGFLAMLVMLASVLVTVSRRERFTFVAGVVLIAGGLTLSEPKVLVVGVALVGFLLVVGSAVPLLSGAE